MNTKIQYVLFDVSGTLLYKPTLYDTIFQVLNKNGYEVSLSEIKHKHKIISEVIHFHDK